MNAHLSITPDIRPSRANFSHYRGNRKREMIGGCKTCWIRVGRWTRAGLPGSVNLKPYRFDSSFKGMRRCKVLPIPPTKYMNGVLNSHQGRKTMKTKTWTVITNSGKRADLESGLEKKELLKPMHISAREFIHYLALDSHIDDDSLRSLFKL